MPDGGTSVLDGAKRWMAARPRPMCCACFAATAADGQVKAFLVDREAAGVTLEVHGETALRMIRERPHHPRRRPRAGLQRLPRRELLRDIAAMLPARPCARTSRRSPRRSAAGAFEAALRYVCGRSSSAGRWRPSSWSRKAFPDAQERRLGAVPRRTADPKQQDKGMLHNQELRPGRIQTCLLMLADHGARPRSGPATASRSTPTSPSRADAGRLLLRGRHQINALIVGRALTGHSAFTR